MPPLSVVAAHVLCYINGNLIGRVTGFTWAANNGHKEIREVDVPTVVEFAPTIIGISGTISLLRTVGDAGAQGAGLIPPQDLISREKYFTLTLVSRKNQETLFQATMCVATGESWGVAAKGVLAGTCVFVGQRWGNSLGS